MCGKYISAKQKEVISLQGDIVSTGGFLGGLLSLSERDALRGEVDKAKKKFNLHIRDDKSSNDLLHVFDPMLFKKLVADIKMTCLTITNILEQLVISSSTSRNTIKTESMKIKAAVHLLASLLDVRDSTVKMISHYCLAYCAFAILLGQQSEFCNGLA